MAYTLQEFCRDTRNILHAGSSRAVVGKITPHLRITGTDLENIERIRVDAATGRIVRVRARTAA